MQCSRKPDRGYNMIMGNIDDTAKLGIKVLAGSGNARIADQLHTNIMHAI